MDPSTANQEPKIPPPPCETNQDDLPPIGSPKQPMSSMFSTKHSTDRLICKTPQGSTTGSVATTKEKLMTPNRVLMLLGVLQFLFGFIMVLFGVYVIAYKASLSNLGGGIWGGILAMTTGISGTLASAKHFCPFKQSAQRMAHTTFLALSLISIAVSQLVVFIASTGLTRDFNSQEFREGMAKVQNMTTFEKITSEIPQNYKGILFNIGLILVSSLECITAAVASYRSSREICPCFRKNEDFYQDNLNVHRSHALVSSWLMEKHGSPASVPASQIYVVAPSSTLGRRSTKMPGTVPMPVYALPPSMVQPQMVGYPLIPAPLGPVPSPPIQSTINRKICKMHKHRYEKSKSKSRSKSRSREPTPNKSRASSREPQITEKDVASTYTGLDRAIAEEFIDICDLKHASLSSSDSSSCRGSPRSFSTNGRHSNSDANSQDCLLNK
ncbi:uncharacterized protein LOC126740542 [Anthonomus grandis grandis]|uniref:uncharacterized protein LOC126740542 n=1 Tax=Anthonomus grandis grandis TaxID=2921223 RepID=UPI002166BA85|nr:uncharacterized protein LOC126740542 [Anthonomus grandis grandis]